MVVVVMGAVTSDNDDFVVFFMKKAVYEREICSNSVMTKMIQVVLVVVAGVRD